MTTSKEEVKRNVEFIIYTIEQSNLSPNILNVKVKRNEHGPSAKLSLRGISSNNHQVQNVVCDELAIKEEQSGIWHIPEKCQNISWEIHIDKDEIPVSSQESTRFGNCLFLSESSSLPRLQDVSGHEYLKIVNSKVDKDSIFPEPNGDGLILLPNNSKKSPPLFVLLNIRKLCTLSSGKNDLKLTYLLDDNRGLSKIPDPSIILKGLQWLLSLIPKKENQDKEKPHFVFAWLGMSKMALSITGVTGDGILPINYPIEGELPLGITPLIYTVLHEACHKLFLDYGERPSWAEESLASYFGLRALETALPDNPSVGLLIKRFIKAGESFTEGLVKINKKVAEGDLSGYGAFYTKGIAFWLAVEEILRKFNDSLDNKFIIILNIQYDAKDYPIGLEKGLNFPKGTFAYLQKKYLDDKECDYVRWHNPKTKQNLDPSKDRPKPILWKHPYGIVRVLPASNTPKILVDKLISFRKI